MLCIRDGFGLVVRGITFAYVSKKVKQKEIHVNKVVNQTILKIHGFNGNDFGELDAWFKRSLMIIFYLL